MPPSLIRSDAFSLNTTLSFTFLVQNLHFILSCLHVTTTCLTPTMHLCEPWFLAVTMNLRIPNPILAMPLSPHPAHLSSPSHIPPHLERFSCLCPSGYTVIYTSKYLFHQNHHVLL
jgi:hypothetical protein